MFLTLQQYADQGRSLAIIRTRWSPKITNSGPTIAHFEQRRQVQILRFTNPPCQKKKKNETGHKHLHNNPKAEVHPGHKPTGPKEEVGHKHKTNGNTPKEQAWLPEDRTPL
jgi:hypothetical protein